MIAQRKVTVARQALNLAGAVGIVLWWFPSFLVLVVSLLARLAWWRLRLALARALRSAGHDKAAAWLLDRLAAEVERHRQPRAASSLIHSTGDRAP